MRGQALVEFALIVPVALFMALGFLEAAFLLGAQATQARATGVVADYAAAHPSGAPWSSVIASEGLASCSVEVDTTTTPDIVRVGATCHYSPTVTRGLWDGLPISTVADAAVLPAPAPSPTPSPTPLPSPSP